MPLASDRLAEQFIGIGHDVRRIEEMIIRQVADRAPVIVGGEHAVPEGCLMQPLLDQAEGVAALCCIRCCGYGCCPCKLAERDPRG